MLEKIIDEIEMTKVEKLKAISENHLMPIDNWWCHIFNKYDEDFINKIKSNPEYKKKYGNHPYNPFVIIKDMKP